MKAQVLKRISPVESRPLELSDLPIPRPSSREILLKISACGVCHTNTVENVWSLSKRSVIGSYHKVSHKHLDAYLDELEWRFNNRENPYLFRDTLLKLVLAENLEYKTLIRS